MTSVPDAERLLLGAMLLEPKAIESAIQLLEESVSPRFFGAIVERANGDPSNLSP